MSKLKIYKASAGSGKTYTLALEYIRELLMKPSENNHRHILAVTFTKDATSEVKDRILAELYGLAFNTDDSQSFLRSMQNKLNERGRNMSETEIREKSGRILHAILQDYSRLNITTIDSFFQRVLRNLARELGTGSRFNLEMNTGKVLTEAVRSMIEKAKPNTRTLEWLTTYIENKLDEGKSWNIEQEIFDFSKCIYNEFFQEHEAKLRQQLKDNPKVFAELGSEQKKTQGECIKRFKAASKRVDEILNQNMLELSDFGNSKYSILFINKLGNEDYSAEIGKNVEKSMGDPAFWGKANSKRKQEIEVLAEKHFIPLLLDTVKALSTYRTSRMITRNLHQLGLIWDITEEINIENKEKNRFMLSDTAQFLNQMIDHSDAPFIYEKLGAEIKHIMIDEFQDTSRLQWNNFKVLLSDILAKDDFSLLVGDVKQSIYRWRNGDWRILNGIEKELNARASTLDYNYRSEKNIVDFNNYFFSKAAFILDQVYKERLEENGESPFLSIYSEENVIQKTHKQEDKGYVSVDFLAKKDEEGNSYEELTKEAVVQKLLELKEAGVQAKDICILIRKNNHIAELGNYLSSLHGEYSELSEGNYLNLISNEAFQLDSSLVIRILIEAMRCISSPENAVAREQLDFYLSSIDSSDNKKLIENVISEKLDDLSQMPLFELISLLYRVLHLERISGQSAYLFTFYDSITAFLNDNPADVSSFLRYWSDDLHKKAIATGESIDGIRAMTIHKSKGLQFHTVIIPYCDWKLNPAVAPTVWCGPKENFYDLELLPISYSKAMNDTIFSKEYKEETIQNWVDNLNVLYVAFTRAKSNLIILAQDNEKLKDILTVSDLLITEVNTLTEKWSAEQRKFETGMLAASLNRKKENDLKQRNENLLKQVPTPFDISFTSNEFQPGKSIFKQSNQSYEFLFPDRPSKQYYVAYGNIMHKLFERVNSVSDIPRAVNSLVSEGIILPEERERYLNKVQSFVSNPQVKDWFSEKYTIYQECTILWEENGEIKQKRPDRVLLSENTTKVIDFKFGEAHAAHKKQVKQYMLLLKEMGYSNVEGYLWYAESNKVEEVV